MDFQRFYMRKLASQYRFSKWAGTGDDVRFKNVGPTVRQTEHLLERIEPALQANPKFQRLSEEEQNQVRRGYLTYSKAVGNEVSGADESYARMLEFTDDMVKNPESLPDEIFDPGYLYHTGGGVDAAAPAAEAGGKDYSKWLLGAGSAAAGGGAGYALAKLIRGKKLSTGGAIAASLGGSIAGLGTYAGIDYLNNSEA